MIISKRKPGRAKATNRITDHRLFPVATAAWAGALLGMVSMAVPVRVLEGGVNRLGVSQVLPAAAPPLGFTAHLLVALLLALTGAGLGLLVGLRLARRSAADSFAMAVPAAAEWAQAPVLQDFPVRARDAHPDAPPRRPLVLSEDLLDEAETTIIDIAPGEVDVLPEDFDGPTPFDMDLHQPFMAEPAAVAAPSPAPFAPPGDCEAEPGPFARPVVDAVAPIVAEPVAAMPVDLPTPAPVWCEPAPVDPAAFDAPPIEAMGVEAKGAADTIAEQVAPPRETASRSPVADMPLDGLGLVQLVERLAHAIAERRVAVADAPTCANVEGEAQADADFVEALVEPVFAAPSLAAMHMARSPAFPPVSAPVVAFPGLRAVASGHVVEAMPEAFPVVRADEADRALRAALATLQRMTVRN